MGEHLPIVADKDPVAFWVKDCKLLEARKLLLVQLDVELSVQSLWVVLGRPVWHSKGECCCTLAGVWSIK